MTGMVWQRRISGLALIAILASLVPAGAFAQPVRSAVVALGLWSDPVFRSEARGAAAIIAGRYGHGGPVIAKANSAGALVAGPDGIAAALDSARRRVDPENDLLFLVLTSHGSPEGIAERGGGREGVVSPEMLSEIVARSGFRHKVLIVSACYSGIFTALADADTLVITAADASHPSFGCKPGNSWTYFGDAFFNRALRRGGPLREVFALARQIVGQREASEGFDASNPQIAGGENVLAMLDGAH